MNNSQLLLDQAREAFVQNRLEEALLILENSVVVNDAEAFFLRGEIYYKWQKWGEALNQFSLYLDQFPSDKRAESYCLLIQNILGFYHKDLYNP